MMKALRLYGPNDIRLVEIPVPTITEGELLIKTDVAAICGTDIRMWQNGYEGVDENHPRTLGHEFAGTIVEVGDNVDLYKPGMQIALAPNIGCGKCNMCVTGCGHLCESYQAFGINMDGAFAEYIRIPAEAVTYGNVMPLPKDVSPAEAAVCEPLSCVYNGSQVCDIKPGEDVLIVGAGPIGIMHAQMADLYGAGRIMMNDLSESRLAECKEIVPKVMTYAGEDLAGFVMDKTEGEGLDVAIVACPCGQVQSDMIPLMNYGGRVNFFGGIPADQQPVSIDTNIVHYKTLYLTGTTRASIIQFRECIEFIAKGLLDINSIITDSFDIDDIMDGFEKAKHAIGLKNVITFD